MRRMRGKRELVLVLHPQEDSENSNIVYKDVSVRAKGVPIAYIPYLRMPDQPLIMKRLSLEAVLTSNLASGKNYPILCRWV